MKDYPFALIDMDEALPIPFGLVRYVVAPDHPEVKDISVAESKPYYDAIVLSYGASAERNWESKATTDC
ncbi:5771_t:CDS:2 [Paraglomus brasilianum]|uniref:5771_t:CDS:1 n=1 Tax=Paraglomus brasilianum TaxID=144538 RepID=A0A9N9CTR4_9GLOM|nr:5771_t:CDS:2 [Paraglomus brasilianum]